MVNVLSERWLFSLAAILGVSALGAAYLVGWPLSAPEARPLLDRDDHAAVSRGHALYETQCASCHGPARGDAPAANAAPSHGSAGHTWEHPDFALVQLTKSGEVAELCRDLEGSDMPTFAEALTDRQIVDVLSYIKSTWPEDIHARNAEINRLYTAQNAAVRDLLGLPDG